MNPIREFFCPAHFLGHCTLLRRRTQLTSWHLGAPRIASERAKLVHIGSQKNQSPPPLSNPTIFYSLQLRIFLQSVIF